MWERYCRGVQAIVYVVDAADHDGLDSGRQELHELLQKPSLARTPLLVLGNKNDLPGALSTTELIERLDLKVRQPVTSVGDHRTTHWLWVNFLLCTCDAACPLCLPLLNDLDALLQALQDREVCVYSISCKNQTNIDKTIEWLMKHAKS